MPEIEQFEYSETRPFETVALESKSADRVQGLAFQLPPGIYSDSFQQRGAFLEATKRISRELESSNIGQALRNLKEGRTVALTITGVPRDPELPPAPLDGGAPKDKKTFVSEGFANGVAMSLGYPSLILAEKKEALVHQITPVPGREASQSNEGAVELKLHQDLAPNPEVPSIPYADFMPDWLILTGVQKGSGHTATYIASLDAALPKISEREKKILQEERFITDPPDSFLKEGQKPEDLRPPVHPILTLRDGHFESAFDTSSNVRPRDPDDAAAAAAITSLNEALASVKQEVSIEPGTSVIFNNRRVVHGRGPVVKEEKDTGAKRWIQRVYIFNPDRVGQEAIARHLKIQIGGGLLRVTGLGTPDLPPEFEKLM